MLSYLKDFPLLISALQTSCTTADGKSGFCVPVVQCPNRGPNETACEIESVKGVCCLQPPEEYAEEGKRFKIKNQIYLVNMNIFGMKINLEKFQQNIIN